MEFYHGQTPVWRLAFDLGGQDGGLPVGPGAEPGVFRVNLGQPEKLTPERVRRAAAKGVKTLRDLGGAAVCLEGAPLSGPLGRSALAALAEGAQLALHAAPARRAKAPKPPMALYLDWPEDEPARAALARANSVARWTCFARDLVNAPANRLTPADMAREMADAAASVGAEAQILDEAALAGLGMEALLTVGRSAAHPPRLIVLRWRGGGAEAPIALVGKGVTCDTGGYCLKAASSMKGIKGDMAGGAAVCGALLALAENKVPVNAVAVIPAAENRISPDSYIPGDVIGSMAGKTIEIGNTDAEGRLILADAVTYALEQEGADRLVDICTLTGAVVAMFGFTTAGLLASDDAFYARFQAAAARTGEQYWRLPMFEEYQKMIESPIADLSNTSSDGCGTITAGLFIGAFTQGRPWIHLDVAGTAWVDAPRREYQVKGATGAGVSTLFELCRSYGEGADAND